MWPWVEPPTKAVIFAPDRGVLKLLSLISISSKHTTAASLWPPTYAAILNVHGHVDITNKMAEKAKTETCCICLRKEPSAR